MIFRVRSRENVYLYRTMVSDANMVTINDVAKAAGVSKGTVDRVLHNRGEVSKKSKEKVLRVIEELGYKPNLYASMLASEENHDLLHNSGICGRGFLVPDRERID